MACASRSLVHQRHSLPAGRADLRLLLGARLGAPTVRHCDHRRQSGALKGVLDSQVALSSLLPQGLPHGLRGCGSRGRLPRAMAAVCSYLSFTVPSPLGPVLATG